MNLLFAFTISLIAACGVYMLLSRHVVRMILGVTLLSAAINLVLFYSGRIVSVLPPVIPAGESVLSPQAANPLPQALILTAIVIGFALTAFVAALALQTQRSIGSLESRNLDQAEKLGTPFDDEPRA